MSVRGDRQTAAAPPPAPTAARVPSEVSVGEFDEDFYVEVHVVGVALRCAVDPQWPCEALLVAAGEAYHAAFPAGEVPDCNVVFHRARQEFLVGGAPIGASCVCGDALELGRTLSPDAEAARSSLGGRDSELGESRSESESEFCVLFHALPLGFTMKRGRDGNTEVGTIYPKSVATLFPRLAPGVAIVRIAGEPLAELGLRQVHDLIKHAGLPLAIHFLGPEPPSDSPTTTPEAAPATQPPASRLPPPSVVVPPAAANAQQQQQRQRHSSFDRRSVRSNGSNGSSRSRGSRGSGRGNKGKSSRAAPQHKNPENQRNGAAARATTPTAPAQGSESNQRGPEQPEDTKAPTTEAALLEQMESLKVALLRKHEEAKQIARQLELCTDKLVALRASSGSASAPHSQQTQSQQTRSSGGSSAPRMRRAATTPSSSGGGRVRLTPEVLEAMDSKAGLPRRGTGAYTSSNVSSVSGYSARSTPTPRAGGGAMRAPRSRASMAIPDNVSVSSYTSQSSHTSGRGGGSRSPRGTALKNLNKRYNYMPQKYAASATGAPEASSTSLSARGAVMSRARISRDSFISKTESPGVGYYDVKVRDRVKGGEIGDSDRSLPWS